MTAGTAAKAIFFLIFILFPSLLINKIISLHNIIIIKEMNSFLTRKKLSSFFVVNLQQYLLLSNYLLIILV